MEDLSVLIGVSLNKQSLADLKKQIRDGRYAPIRLKADTTDVDKKLRAIRSQLKSMSNFTLRLNMNTGSGGSRGGLTNTNKELSDFIRLSTQIQKTRIKIRGFELAGGKDNQVVALRQNLEELEVIYSRLMGTFMKKASTKNMPFEDILAFSDEIERDVRLAEATLKDLDEAVIRSRQELAKGIVTNIDNGNLVKEEQRLTASFDNIKNKTVELTSAFEQYIIAKNNLITAKDTGDYDEVIAKSTEYENALKRVKVQLDINTESQKRNQAQQALAEGKKKLIQDMDAWLQKSDRIAKKYGATIDELKIKLQSADKVDLKNIEAEFKNVRDAAKHAGDEALTFAQRLKMQMSKLSTYYSAAMIITQATRALRQMYEEVVAVDTAMTELYRVTDLTSSQYDKLYKNMTKSAKEYGSTLTDIISSTADWVRLGFDENTSNRLAEITSMYQHISDLDNSVAVENLVTAYKGYQNELLNMFDGDTAKAVEYVADIFNELGKIMPLKNYIG